MRAYATNLKEVSGPSVTAGAQHVGCRQSTDVIRGEGAGRLEELVKEVRVAASRLTVVRRHN